MKKVMIVDDNYLSTEGIIKNIIIDNIILL